MKIVWCCNIIGLQGKQIATEMYFNLLFFFLWIFLLFSPYWLCVCVLCECTGVYWCAREVCACGCVLAASLSLSLKLCEEHALNSTLFIFFSIQYVLHKKMYFTKKKLYFFYQYNYSLYIRIHIYLWFKHTQNSCPKLASQGVPKLKYKYEKKKMITFFFGFRT